MSLQAIFFRKNPRVPQARVDKLLKSSRPRPALEPPKTFGRRIKRPQVAASDLIYFAVRSLGVRGRDHVLQYAFVDDRGTVVMSALVRSEAPAAIMLGASAEDLMMDPLEEEVFASIAGRLCHGATLVGYQRVLQGGLLPAEVAGACADMECVWRRFRQAARRRGLPVSDRDPLTLNDCLALANLPVPPSEDAALRALAIRDLWRWLEETD